MIKDNGGAAFPRPLSRDELTDTLSWEQEGMTLRDYFAAKVMQASLTSGYLGGVDMRSTARLSYQMADAMLEARKQ